MDNNYSNIISPSDGVRRFLCKTSMLVVSFLSAVFCACGFRMTALEAQTLGSTLRSNMMYAAYIMVPLGLITAAIFARARKMGLAFSMISLLLAMAGSFLLMMNAVASLLREGRMLGISGSALELLTFAALFALITNLVMSCMEYRLQPVIGIIGACSATLAMIVTSVRTVLSFSALSFAWKPEFDWINLSNRVDTEKLKFHAEWIFRSIPMGNPDALKTMFTLRFAERVSACVFYALVIMIFLKFQKEMKAFNKLLAHASEYVDIPTARIYQNIFGSGAKHAPETIIQTQEQTQTKQASRGSVKNRLRELSNMTKAREQGMDISDLADQYDARRINESMEDRYYPDAEELNYSDDNELTEEERYIMESRRRLSRSYAGYNDNQRQTDDSRENQIPGQRRRDGYGENENPGQRRRNQSGGNDRAGQRRRNGYGENENPGQRRRNRSGGNDRAGQPRRDGYGNKENPGQRRRPPEREPSDQEKYLMEERRKRQQRIHPDARNNRR